MGTAPWKITASFDRDTGANVRDLTEMGSPLLFTVTERIKILRRKGQVDIEPIK